LEAFIIAQGNGAGGGFFESLGIMPLIAMIGVLFYFMILRPETRRRSDQEKMHKDLKKNDRIVTIGGIFGTVVATTPDSDEITIKVDEGTNTKIRITRSAVQKVLNQ
jgi:preprotein translocase subunit YajC